jgi:glutaredoxin
VFRPQDGRSERAIFLVDPGGIIRYVDIHDIDDQPDNEVLFDQIAAASGTVSTPTIDAPESDRESAAADVVMYCTPWCPDCRAAREWLADHAIEYLEIDISKDPIARETAAGYNEGRLHTPTFEIGADICVDFRPDRLSELLDLS